MPKVKIDEYPTGVVVTVEPDDGGSQQFSWSEPGMLTGADLQEVLLACGNIEVEYELDEGNDDPLLKL